MMQAIVSSRILPPFSFLLVPLCFPVGHPTNLMNVLIRQFMKKVRSPISRFQAGPSSVLLSNAFYIGLLPAGRCAGPALRGADWLSNNRIQSLGCCCLAGGTCSVLASCHVGKYALFVCSLVIASGLSFRTAVESLQ